MFVSFKILNFIRFVSCPFSNFNLAFKQAFFLPTKEIIFKYRCSTCVFCAFFYFQEFYEKNRVISLSERYLLMFINKWHSYESKRQEMLTFKYWNCCYPVIFSSFRIWLILPALPWYDALTITLLCRWLATVSVYLFLVFLFLWYIL